VLGAICVFLGGGTLVNYFIIEGAPTLGDSNYATGRKIGIAFGALMFVAGLFALFGKPKPKN
jgi:hypothetical protein